MSGSSVSRDEALAGRGQPGQTEHDALAMITQRQGASDGGGYGL